jgi:hypothetical protein
VRGLPRRAAARGGGEAAPRVCASVPRRVRRCVAEIACHLPGVPLSGRCLGAGGRRNCAADGIGCLHRTSVLDSWSSAGVAFLHKTHCSTTWKQEFHTFLSDKQERFLYSVYISRRSIYLEYMRLIKFLILQVQILINKCTEYICEHISMPTFSTYELFSNTMQICPLVKLGDTNNKV